MRWPPPGPARNNPDTNCAGENLAPPYTPPNYAGSASERGFIDIGLEPGATAGTNGSAFIRNAIVFGVQSHGVRLGDVSVHVNGHRKTENDALKERVGQDTDPYSTTYAQYLTGGSGNNRRVVYMPMNDAYGDNTYIEFGMFFLPPANTVCGLGVNDACCAEYIGPGTIQGGQGADDDPGVFTTKLIM